jgi:hypothetical protein
MPSRRRQQVDLMPRRKGLFARDMLFAMMCSTHGQCVAIRWLLTRPAVCSNADVRGLDPTGARPANSARATAQPLEKTRR